MIKYDIAAAQAKALQEALLRGALLVHTPKPVAAISAGRHTAPALEEAAKRLKRL